MPWVKIDDVFYDNPKIIAVGRDGRDLYLAALCYANKHETKGFVPEYVLAQLAAKAGVIDVEAAVQRLCTVYRPNKNSLWARVDDGFQIHDYHEYQPTPEQIEDLREKRAEAGRKGGQRSAEARAANKAQPTLPEANEASAIPTSEANSEAKTEASAGVFLSKAEAKPEQNTNPVSRIPDSESRIPSPDTQPPLPPVPLPARASPPAANSLPPPAELSQIGAEGEALDAGCLGVFGEMLSFLGRKPTPTEDSQARRVLKRAGCEAVRWQCVAMRWRETEYPEGHPRHVQQPYAYLLDAITKEYPLPAAVKEQYQAETEAGQKAKAQMERELEIVWRSAKGQNKEAVQSAWEGLPPDVQKQLEEEARKRAISVNPLFGKQAKVDPSTWFMRPGAASVIQQQRIIILTERGLLPSAGAGQLSGPDEAILDT